MKKDEWWLSAEETKKKEKDRVIQELTDDLEEREAMYPDKDSIVWMAAQFGQAKKQPWFINLFSHMGKMVIYLLSFRVFYIAPRKHRSISHHYHLRPSCDASMFQKHLASLRLRTL